MKGQEVPGQEEDCVGCVLDACLLWIVPNGHHREIVQQNAVVETVDQFWNWRRHG